MKFSVSFFALLCVTTAVPARAVTVTFVDLIPDASRTNFNGFEAYAAGLDGMGPPTHIEDGIRVDQIGGPGNNIWSACAACFGGTLDGVRAWYPNGADQGYTRIVRTPAIDFVDVGVRTGSGWLGSPVTVLYQLWDDGALVLSGGYSTLGGAAGYLGFAGGGFDEIRLRDSTLPGARFGDGSLNAFALDSIELAGEPIPEPATLLLLGAGLVALRARRRRSS